MAPSDNQTLGYTPISIFFVLLIIFMIWALAGGRSPFRHNDRDFKATVHDAGQDLKSTGRDAAASIRDSVQ